MDSSFHMRVTLTESCEPFRLQAAYTYYEWWLCNVSEHFYYIMYVHNLLNVMDNRQEHKHLTIFVVRTESIYLVLLMSSQKRQKIKGPPGRIKQFYDIAVTFLPTSPGVSVIFEKRILNCRVEMEVKLYFDRGSERATRTPYCDYFYFREDGYVLIIMLSKSHRPLWNKHAVLVLNNSRCSDYVYATLIHIFFYTSADPYIIIAGFVKLRVVKL